MKRKLLSVILSFLFVFSMAISVSASADGIEDGSTTISPRAHDVEAKRELVNTQTLVKHPIGYAKGQPSNGTVFPCAVQNFPQIFSSCVTNRPSQSFYS